MVSGKAKELALGTIRIRTADLAFVHKTASGWQKINVDKHSTLNAIKQYKAHDKLDLLIDTKHPEFLKGQLSLNGQAQGARINELPNGKKLDKAFSLFSPELTVHDESSHDHWDVLYKNPGGTYSYVYTLEKKKLAKDNKYKKVQEFKRHYPKLKNNVSKALKNEEDHLSLPMFTLLKTCMRVGSEIYFKTHGHKGLTTLQKQDIDINGNKVTFNYLGKDGVPINITETFPASFMKRFQELLDDLEEESFIFTTVNGHPLSDTHFKSAFLKYCGKEFYPHIVRSYYATEEVNKFLKTHKAITKDEFKEICTSIAHKLGHKKFDKKSNEWKESYTVTLNHYIQPELVDKLKSITK